jgi:hypothetical protein
VIVCRAAGAQAQDANSARALGSVLQIDSTTHEMTVRGDAGDSVAVTLGEKANVRRAAPGETNLRNTAVIAASDIQPGDRVLVRGRAGAEPKSIVAALVVVMSKADIANKQALEQTDWERRGVMGVVTEAASDHVAIQLRTPDGVKTLTLKPAPGAAIRRYAPDSVRFADAKRSSLEEIGKGDQVRARGEKSADGASMLAEEIVSGSFRTIAGLVTAVDAPGPVVRITNLATKTPLAVKFTMDSKVRRMSPELAQRVATRLRGSKGSDGGAEDLQQLFERMPVMAVADLKAGEAIIVSATAGTSADEVTAINLFAGVEPILRRPGSSELSLGDASGLAAAVDIGGLGQ